MQKYQLRKDFLASIVVFLIAIPLCLGIALACGVPLFSGILSGIIGGIIVGILSESQFSVSGPAAGMIAVVVAAIAQLGSFEVFLFALTIAGVLQIICGILRAGFIANFVPTTVIQGLLAAIGILIIIKQLPLALGYFAEANSLKSALQIAQENLSFEPIIHVLRHINITATTITIISLALLIGWEKLLPKAAKIVPAAVIVVLLGMGINEILLNTAPAFALKSANLVNIPVNETFKEFLQQFRYPDFSQWKNINIYISAVTIAIVASLETLLNLEGVEKLDPKHRYCSRNKELIAQGVGNITSGLLGGLPITSVIVRSSVNINAGAESKLSTIIHGFLLLFSITVLTKWLNYIPIAALAAILIHTGYKLAKISLFKEVYKEGWRYFIPFLITVIAIVFTNLLLGIVIGLVVSIFFILRRNSQTCFTHIDETHPSGKVLRLVLPSQVTFLNKAAIIEELQHLPINTKVIIDAKSTDYIDNDILEIIKDFSHLGADNKKILLNLEGFKRSYDIKNVTNFINVTSHNVQAALTPDMILRILKEGNHRFVKNIPINKNYKQQIVATSKSQHPLAVILSCIDSRVPVEIIFDLSVGDVFVTRIAGNIANADILASIEFACAVAGAKAIIVLGHKECGAIKAACDNVALHGHLPELIKKIKPAIELETETETDRTSNNKEFLEHVILNNIYLTQEYLYNHSKILRELIETKNIGLFAALYDVQTGRVEFLKQSYSHL